jgi:hypothetical protein
MELTRNHGKGKKEGAEIFPVRGRFAGVSPSSFLSLLPSQDKTVVG